jgi:DNA-binding PadR family transcriptional regulator
MFMTVELSTWGRYSEPAMLILVSLAPGPKHGYRIMEDIREMTGTPMRAGTLYAALNRLEHQGLIEALASEARRKPYRLTTSGAATLRDQLTSLREFASMALSRLGAN